MITRYEYAEFVAESRSSADNTWEDPALRQPGGNPVVNVNWVDARAYVRWLSAKTLRQYRRTVGIGVRVCRARRIDDRFLVGRRGRTRLPLCQLSRL